MRNIVLGGSVLIVVVASLGCQSPYYADRGAAVGAVTGALAGAALGDDSGEAAAGAVIGSAVGGLTGAAVGNAIDQDVAHAQALIEQRMGRKIAGSATVTDVVAMSQAGLSDDVIRTHIGAHGVAHPPQVQDLITMRNAGVSDTVIQAMQQTPPPQFSSTPPPVANPPVIVQEHHYVTPPYPPFGPYRYHRHWHRPRQGGVSWGVAFGN